MKTFLVSLAFFLLFTMSASAQGRPGGGGSGGGTGGTKPSPTPSPRPTPNIGSRQPLGIPEIQRPAFVSGKVVLADGSELTEPAAIQTVCDGRRRTETYTDSRGGFSFELGRKSNQLEAQLADASTEAYSPRSPTELSRWRNCELQAVLPGFTSEAVPLARVMATFENTDVGRITLRPLGQVVGSILSVTSMAAPKDAKKAFEKAREHLKKNKLPEAQQSLEKAVAIYPQYAVAWTELGRLQHMNHDNPSARHSFEQALAADSKYVNSYLGLAQLAFEAQQWQEVVNTTDRLLALNSVNFPSAWLFNSVGHYYLHNGEAAEKSARNGIKVDEDHHYPKLEYLLGILLMEKKSYGEAAQHMRAYLQSSTQPADVAEAQKRLAEIEQLSASTGISAQPK